jgi:hypothetical protein
MLNLLAWKKGQIVRKPACAETDSEDHRDRNCQANTAIRNFIYTSVRMQTFSHLEMAIPTWQGIPARENLGSGSPKENPLEKARRADLSRSEVGRPSATLPLALTPE